MKNTFFLTTLISISFFTFVFSTQAQEVAVFTSGGNVIDSVIQQAKITEWTEDKKIYVIEFDVVNNLDKTQEGIKYALELYDSTKEQGKFLVDQTVYDEIITLEPKGRTRKRVQYNFPVSFQGEYELHLLTATEDGIEFDRKVLGAISKDKSEGIDIDITQCQNKIGFDEQHIFKEMDLFDEESFEIRCKNLKNLSKGDLVFNPKVIIKQQTKFGKVIGEEILEQQNLKSGQEQNFSFQIPVMSNGLYRYKGELMLIGANQKKISNSIYFNYVFKKDKNGDNISDFDENEINSEQIDIENKITDFSVKNVIVGFTIIIILILIIILIIRNKQIFLSLFGRK
ncbi:MAG: hypothetical protein KAT32_01205 [Candidatus Moranbacteria bacterium]|nr:hypothetical protein [Candidatus Moranbacteria bacterium]